MVTSSRDFEIFQLLIEENKFFFASKIETEVESGDISIGDIFCSFISLISTSKWSIISSVASDESMLNPDEGVLKYFYVWLKFFVFLLRVRAKDRRS